MVKIYVRNKPLYLVDAITEAVEDYIHRPETIFLDELNPPAIRTMLQQLERDEYYQGVFVHHDLNSLLQGFKNHLTVIQAAGGLVYTEDNHILLIFRRGKWDLPKGKLDAGEDLKTCAVREISEETGLKNLSMEEPLLITYHTYHEQEKNILKESHWYVVKAAVKEVLTPQVEEDIEKCEWVPLNSLESYKSNMHASIIDVINLGLKRLSL